MSIESFDVLDNEAHIWYVVFTNGEDGFWWQSLLKPGFRHCFVIRADGDRSLMVSHHGFRLGISTHDMPAEEFAQAQADGGYTVVEYQHFPEAKVAYRTIMTCVSSLINVIGITGLLAFTPYQLYRALLKRGGRVMESCYAESS